MAYLEQAMVHVSNASKAELSLEYLARDLDVCLALDVALLALQHAPGGAAASSDAAAPQVDLAARHLQSVTRVFPSHAGAMALGAVCLFQAGQAEAAHRKAMGALQACPELAEAHLLVARVHLAAKNTALAKRSLEQGATQGFRIRLLPQHHVLTARVQMAEGDHAAALKTLAQAERMPGMRGRDVPRVRYSKGGSPVLLHDRAEVPLLQAKCLVALGKKAEATKAVARAVGDFQGTPEEAAVTLAGMELKIALGDVSGAIRDMEAVPPTSPVYAQARVALARIYLEKRRDRAAYVRCYQDLVDLTQDKQAYVMYGEAMLHVQEPLMAVGAFKEALRRDPRDGSLALRIGSALVATHDFEGAVDYYCKAVNANRQNVDIALELASLYARIGSEGSAAQILRPLQQRQGTSLEDIRTRQRATMVLADLARRLGRQDEYLATMEEALAEQGRLLEAMRGEHPEMIQSEKSKAADLAFKLYTTKKEMGVTQDGIEVLREILLRAPWHAAAGLALARMHVAAGQVDEGMTLCQRMLMEDESNEEASMLLAEIAAAQGDFEPAIGRFQMVLAQKPDNFAALFRLLEVLRRTGNLEMADDFLDAAKNATPRSASTAGFHICQGLYLKHTNQPQEALRSLNRARGDPEWGREATYLMCDVFLDPNSERLWAAAGDDEDVIPENFQAAAAGENLKAVGELLMSLQVSPATASVRHRVLETYGLMATGEKGDAEQALSLLIDLAAKDRENVPILLAMATAFMILRQKPKARNQLKRISKLPYTTEYADDFEKAWLSLGAMYLKGGKFDLANELCQKCLRYNQSCAQAWELMGQILEKEGAYKDAAEHYHQAWDLMHQGSAQAGYRLGFNYLKAGKVVEAIEVCHQVLAKFPEYETIRTDVLEKAWAMVKTPASAPA